MNGKPDPVDVHVGARVRMRRILAGVSQSALGSALGVTFQQVQKYEKGANRVSASRFQQISTLLGVTPAYFFEGVTEQPTPPLTQADHPAADDVEASLLTPEGARLAGALSLIRDAHVRRRILDLVEALAAVEMTDPG